MSELWDKVKDTAEKAGDNRPMMWIIMLLLSGRNSLLSTMILLVYW